MKDKIIEKINSVKCKVLLGSSAAFVAVATTCTNAFAADGDVTIDYASIATNTKTSVLSGINAMLPTLAILFGTITAIKFAPRLIKKFLG